MTVHMFLYHSTMLSASILHHACISVGKSTYIARQISEMHQFLSLVFQITFVHALLLCHCCKGKSLIVNVKK